MNTNGHESGRILHANLVYSIVECALEVMRGLGHGLHERPYESALVVELGLRSLSFQQQRRFKVTYKGVEVSEFVPDLIVGESVVVDTKVVDRMTDHERGQMLNYLRITGLRVGLIINCKRPKLEWERVVL